MEQVVSPPPSKKSKVAIAVEGGGGRDEGMMCPLMLLATAACEVAEEEERALRVEPLRQGVVVGSCNSIRGADQEEEVKRERKVRLRSPISDDPIRRGINRIRLKKTMPPTVISMLPSSLNTGTCDVVDMGVATGPAAAALASISGNTVAMEGDQKRMAAVEVAENNRPYKKLKKTTSAGEPSAAGWVEKMVRMGGWNPWFVVKKQLSDTDLKTHYSRLPLPVSKDSDPQKGGAEKLVFTFSDLELEEFWNGEGLPVMLLDRWGREYNGGRLRLWGSKGWIVLKGGGVWPSAARFMGLRPHDTVEVLSFRVRPPKEAAGMLVLVLLPALEVAQQ